MRTVLQLFAACLFASGSTWAQLYVVSTVAGGAPPPTPAPAINASLGSTSAVATDSAGNVYFASDNAIFRVDTAGVLTRVAGTSRAGFSGDGGPAVAAQLNTPTSVAIDAANNLYIAEFGNGRIRKVNTSGIITTVASAGYGPATFRAPLSLAVDSQGAVYFSDQLFLEVEKVLPDGNITPVVVRWQQYAAPYGLAFAPSGTLYIADSNYGRILTVSPDGTIGSVPATVGDSPINPQFIGLTGVAVDSARNLYIANQQSCQIFRIAPGGTATVVAGSGVPGFSGDGGAAVNAQLNQPTGVAVDAKGNLYISDSSNYRIREVTPDGVMHTIAGNGQFNRSGDLGPATAAQLGSPQGSAVDAHGNLYVADQANHRVRKLTPGGTITTVAGTGVPGFSGDNGPADQALLNGPTDVAVDSTGNLFIADDGNARIRKVAAATGIITTVAGGAVSDCNACNPSGLGDNGPATKAQLLAPHGVAVDQTGNLYIADAGDNAIRKVTPDGVITTLAYAGSIVLEFQFPFQPRYLAVATDGSLYVSQGNGVISKFSTLGVATVTQSYVVSPIALDASGNLYFGAPYPSSECGTQISRLTPANVQTTIAQGRCAPGYSGDGGAALNAAFTAPGGISVDANGNVYVSDTRNGAIRLLQPTTHAALISAVVNAASETAGPVAPGEIVILYGAGLGPDQLITSTAVDGVIGKELGGATVSFNGIAATVLYASATQVAAIVPYGVSGSTVQVTASYQGQTSPVLDLPLAASAPGLFTRDGSNAGPAAADNSFESPAPVGGYVTLWATGEGQTAPPGVDGKIASVPLPHTSQRVGVTIGGVPAEVTYYGAAPGQVAGLMQVNVKIPPGVAAGGYVPVTLTIGDASSQPGVTLSIK